jgi:hypothetical protein
MSTTIIYANNIEASLITTTGSFFGADMNISTLRAANAISTTICSTNTLIFSSMMMEPATYSTATLYNHTTSGYSTASILINIAGSTWKIPIERVQPY